MPSLATHITRRPGGVHARIAREAASTRSSNSRHESRVPTAPSSPTSQHAGASGASRALRATKSTSHPPPSGDALIAGDRVSTLRVRTARVWTPRTFPHPYRTSREHKYFQASHCVEQAPTRPRWIRRHDTLVREEDDDAARGGSLARLAASRGETRGDTQPASGTQAARVILLLLQELLPLQEDPRPSVAQPGPPPSPGDGSNAAEGCAGADALEVIRGVEDSGVAAVPPRSVRRDTHTAE